MRRTSAYAAIAALTLLWLSLPGITTASENEGNPPTVECGGSEYYKLDGGEQPTAEWSAEFITGVVLAANGVFDAGIADGWDLFRIVVKAGRDSTVHEPPVLPIQLPENWSHVTLCAQEEVPSSSTSTTGVPTTTEPPSSTTTTVPSGSSTTTESPGTTTSTSTTFPPSTTSSSTSTSTTVAATTTSSTVPSSTTAGPTSSTVTSSTTTEPPGTTSSSVPSTTGTTTFGPPDVTIDVAVRCGTVEPIETVWSGTYTEGSTEFQVTISVEMPPGNPVGALEIFQLPTKRDHQDWIGGPLPDGPIRLVVLVDGEVHAEATDDCSDATATTTSVVATTIPSDLPRTGDPLIPLTVGGALLTTLGAAFLTGSRRSRRSPR